MRNGAVRVLAVVMALGSFACGNKLLKDAQKYIDVKEYGRARELLDLEIKSDPKNVDAYLLLGKVQLMEIQLEAAGQSFDRALLLSTKSKGKIGQAYFEAAQALYGDKDRRGAAGRAIEVYLDKTTTYDPDSKRKVSAWALQEAAKAIELDKSTDPIGLLQAAGKMDTDARREIGTFALGTAQRYQEKSFLKEAIAWAMLAGEMSPDVLKDASAVLRNAGILLPLPEEKALAVTTLEKAWQWNRALDDDDDFYWITRVKLGKAPDQGAMEYLKRFPTGKYASEARPIVDVETFRTAMGHIRSLATAVEAFAVDFNRYPKALTTWTGPGTGPQTAEEQTVAPTYIREIPQADPWGAPYLYETDPYGQNYRIISGGNDRTISPSRPPLPATPSLTGPFPTSALGEDIVYQNGQFIRYPEFAPR